MIEVHLWNFFETSNMKLTKKIAAFYRADDVSNDMGGGCLVAAIRWFLTLILAVLIISVIVNYLIKI